jgi:phosphatidylinositol alpha-mannosyltransferase
MRVALVCPYSLAAAGGVQQQVVGLAGALAAAGDDVTLLAPTGSGPYRPAVAGDVGVVLVGRSMRVPANGSRAPVALSPATARRTVEALRRLRPEVVHVHEPLAPAVGLAAALAHVAPTVATFHRAGVGLGYRAVAPLARRVAGGLDCCAAVSEPARDTLAAVLRRDPGCELVWNGVDVDRFARAEPWPEQRPSVLFASRHEHRKGLDVLLEAFVAVPGDARLVVVSSGPQTDRLRRRSHGDPRIEWCGVVSDDELARRLAAATVFVAPSRGGESFGLVLLEAMAAGAAVVASDLPGYRLAAGDAACYVPPGEPDPLAKAISELLADDHRRAVLIEAGRSLVVERSYRRLAAWYRARYRQVTAGASR